MNKIREAAKKYFEEELSGEPLRQDLVIDWLTDFAEQQIKHDTQKKLNRQQKDIIVEMAESLNKEVMICSHCGAKAYKHESGLCYGCWVLSDGRPMKPNTKTFL